MSKKIVYFDKEVFEQKIKGWIERRPYVTSKDFLLLIDGFITEIDTDQSIEERVKQYPMGDILSVYRAMTEQDLISKAREREKKCVHPYNRVYIDKKERYCVLCGKDLTTI